MRAVIQRVNGARITINRRTTKEMGPGLVVLLGIEERDDREDVDWLAGKISRLRIFDDESGVMNLPVTETNGDLMIVSQFTLLASTRKGNRPSYIRAAQPDVAIPLYESFLSAIQKFIGKEVITGEFGAHMRIDLTNDGPVTILIDTKNRE